MLTHRWQPRGRCWITPELGLNAGQSGTSPTSSEQVDGEKEDAHSTLPVSATGLSRNPRNSTILAHSYGPRRNAKANLVSMCAYALCLFPSYFNGLSHRHSVHRFWQEVR